jgi:hypothetical protein
LKTAKGGAAIVRVGARKKIKGWASPPRVFHMAL